MVVMSKIFLLLFTIMILLSGCHGCSFIQEKFGKKQQETPPEQQQTNPADSQHRTDPIPVNPQHS